MSFNFYSVNDVSMGKPSSHSLKWCPTPYSQLKLRIDNMVKTVEMIERKNHPSIYERAVVRHSHRILKDPSHILHSEYELLNSTEQAVVKTTASITTQQPAQPLLMSHQSGGTVAFSLMQNYGFMVFIILFLL